MWRKIKNVIGPAHEVDENGNIRQCVAWRNGLVRNLRRIPSVDRNGFLYIVFRDGTKQQNRKVHHLVADAFLSNPRGYKFVEFVNGDKSDCRACNLKRASKQRRPIPVSRGVKLATSTISLIRHLHGTGMSGVKIAEKAGISPSMVSRIINKKRWGWVA